MTIHAIDEEVRRIIDINYQLATGILKNHLDKLHAMASALIKFETIDDSQIRDIMAGREPQPPEGWDNSGSGTPSGSFGNPKPAGETGIGEPASQHRSRT